MTLAATSTLLLVAALAATSDVLKRRVTNRLNLAILLLGLGWRAALEGGWSPLIGMAGVGVGLGLLIIPFASRWVGAGDVKLLAALGAWLGPTATFWACLYGLAGGGLLAIALAVAGGAEVRRSVTTNLTTSFLTLSTPDAPRRAKSLTVPLAVPLAIAASAVFISSGGF